MAEYPAMPLWTDAYLGDTHHLSTIEHGAYLLLLIAMWRTKERRLPSDDRSLAKYARLTTGQWSRIKGTILPFFDDVGGFITQGRLTDEAIAVRQLSKSQSKKAKGRWDRERERKLLVSHEAGDAGAHAGHMPDDSNGNPEAMPGGCPTDASHTHTHTHKKDLTAAADPTTPREAQAQAEDAAAAAAAQPEDDFHSRVLEAAGIDVTKDTSGRWFNSDQRWRSERWLKELGLTPELVLSEIRTLVARRKVEIGTLKFFDGVMQEAAARLAAPPLTPTPSTTGHGAPSASQSNGFFDSIIREYAPAGTGSEPEEETGK